MTSSLLSVGHHEAAPMSSCPIPHGVRGKMERVFNADFSGVRAFEGPAAATLGVRAFACGNQIHFAPGCYRPEECAGQRLLAHELAHVVQQRDGRAVNPHGSGIALIDDPALEAEANAWARAAVSARCVPGICSGGRQPAHGRITTITTREFWQGPPLVLQCDDDEEDDNDLPKSKWTNVVSRHRTEKRVATGAMTVASLGIQAASLATGASSIAVASAVAAGAAVSATGIGLIAVGGALTLGGMALGAKSAYSTAQHLKKLEALYARRGELVNKCKILSSAGGESLNAEFGNLHGWVADKVLPWIIRQKKHKLGKKIGSAAGGGLLVGLWSAGRKAYKAARGTLGKRRTYFAECLAVHLITARCPLAEMIVAELYSEAEMNAIKQMCSEQAAPLIADKMKSV